MDVSYSNYYYAIVSVPERTLHVFVGMPVVIPAFVIQKVPEMEFPASIKLYAGFKATITGFLHRRCATAPIVEITSYKSGLNPFCLLRLNDEGNSTR